MRKYLIGCIVGILLTAGSTVFAEQAKQFVLSLANYPIYVNGQQYQDKELPILQYNGSTYVPLAKLGDLTGVDYIWNDQFHRVEINTTGTVIPIPDPPAVKAPALYVTDGKGEYAGYQMLHGYPGEDQYEIYFKGVSDRYTVTYNELKKANLNESITWQYGGKTYKSTRRDLYSLFSDESAFRTNYGISGSDNWLPKTFGSVYMDWERSYVGLSSDAKRWVEQYFTQTGQGVRSNVTLTPDAVVRPVK